MCSKRKLENYCLTSLQKKRIYQQTRKDPAELNDNYLQRIIQQDNIASKLITNANANYDNVHVGVESASASSETMKNNPHTKNSEDSEDELCLTERLRDWHIKYNISEKATDELLKILRRAGRTELPLTTKALLQTPRKNTIKILNNECSNFQRQHQQQRYKVNNLHAPNEVSINKSKMNNQGQSLKFINPSNNFENNPALANAQLNQFHHNKSAQNFHGHKSSNNINNKLFYQPGDVEDSNQQIFYQFVCVDDDEEDQINDSVPQYDSNPYKIPDNDTFSTENDDEDVGSNEGSNDDDNDNEGSTIENENNETIEEIEMDESDETHHNMCCRKCQVSNEKLFELILNKLNDLGEKIDNLPRNIVNSTHFQEVGEDLLPEFPINNWNDLEKLNESIQTDRKCYLQLEHTIKNVGGNNYVNFINRVLAKLIGNELATQITWTGYSRTPDQKVIQVNKFGVTAIAHLICHVVTQNCADENPPPNIAMVESRIKKWFQHAGERLRKNNEDKITVSQQGG